MKKTTKTAVFFLAGVALGSLLTAGSLVAMFPKSSIEKFCQQMIEATQNNRGYKDAEILAGCFEELTGKKIELN